MKRAKRNYGAFVLDLPGCVATGQTLDEVKVNMRGALKMHLEGMIEDREPIPIARTMAEYMDISIPDSVA